MAKNNNNNKKNRSQWPSSKSLQTINVGEGVKKREPSWIVGWNVNWYNHSEDQYESSLETKNRTTIWSSMEKAMASHSRTLAWKIPWMEDPGRLQSMGLQRVRHDWVTSLSLSYLWTLEFSWPLLHSPSGAKKVLLKLDKHVIFSQIRRMHHFSFNSAHLLMSFFNKYYMIIYKHCSRHTSKQSKNPWPHGVYIPNGRLAAEVGMKCITNP